MKKLYILFAVLIAAFTQQLFAQGCVAVRQMGGLNPLGTMSYNLSKGEMQAGASYRYFHSFRHYVGSVEQPYRQNTQGGFNADGTERGNAVNIYSHSVDLNFSYALTNRLQINVSIPYVHNERSQVLATKTGAKILIGDRLRDQTLEGTRYSVYAQGLGDIRLSGNYWILNPSIATKGNLMLGLGVKLNTGSHSETDDALKFNKTTNTFFSENEVMDQAIQPGDGGIGFSLEAQGFRELTKNIYGFANGYYLFNPREANGTFKSAPTVGLEGYNIYAAPDQYFARAGAMINVGKTQNLTFSLASRLEGIPAYDAIGGQVAYRRPGYVIAVEPGASYRLGNHTFSLFVPKNVYRNRIQSAADIASENLQNAVITDPAKYVHVQGDAAFADYSINLSYSVRFGAKHKMAKNTIPM